VSKAEIITTVEDLRRRLMQPRAEIRVYFVPGYGTTIQVSARGSENATVTEEVFLAAKKRRWIAGVDKDGVPSQHEFFLTLIGHEGR
jgi:hypothetical protein